MENTKSSQLLTKKDLFRASYRWLLSSQICWNYERMMSTGYLYTMLPFLERRYGSNPEQFKDMLRTHNQFFNCNPMMGHFIVGIDLGIEEQEGHQSKSVVSGIKAGLMGPFSGVGDTVFGVLLPTILGSIAAYMGQNGNATGVIIWLLVNIAICLARLTFIPFGYKQGAKIVSEFGDKLNALTDAAILLGITVVGALIPTVIRANVSLVYNSGKIEMKFQSILDQIMPALVPVCLVLFIYWLLGKNGMTSAKAIILVMIISILAYNLNILS